MYLPNPFLSIIIPAFNEKECIGSTLTTLQNYLKAQSYSWEIIVVDDGSSDTTNLLASKLSIQEQRIRVEKIPHSGKGWAVKHGILISKGDYLFMCDADLAMPIDQLPKFLCQMQNGYDIVIGSRQISGAIRIGEPLGIHIRGRLYNWLVRLVTKQDFMDTQCGFKCFKSNIAKRLFKMQKTKGFGFDVEILYLATREKLRILEIPIIWHFRNSSKVRPFTDSLLMTRDAFWLRLRRITGK